MSETEAATSPPDRPRRRWGRIVGVIALLLGLALVGIWLARRAVVVEVIGPDKLIVHMELTELADGYYDLLVTRNWQIVRETGNKGHSYRTFRLEDGIEITADMAHDGDRHVVLFTSYDFKTAPDGKPPADEAIKRRCEQVTQEFAHAWREKARENRWKRLERLMP